MTKKITLVFALMFAMFSYGQKMKIQKGDFSFIKGQKEINVEFIYDNLTINKDKMTDEAYIKERSAKLEEKSRGKGKAWAKKWVASRELIFAPKFLELINKYVNKNKERTYFAEDLTAAKYTLFVDAVWVYPGYNVGIMKKGAKLSTKLTFVETANRDNILLEMTGKNAPGDVFGGSFSNEDRIGESFAKTGKTLAGMLLKKAYK
jgi:hypothetical protein